MVHPNGLGGEGGGGGGGGGGDGGGEALAPQHQQQRKHIRPKKRTTRTPAAGGGSGAAAAEIPPAKQGEETATNAATELKNSNDANSAPEGDGVIRSILRKQPKYSRGGAGVGSVASPTKSTVTAAAAAADEEPQPECNEGGRAADGAVPSTAVRDGGVIVERRRERKRGPPSKEEQKQRSQPTPSAAASANKNNDETAAAMAVEGYVSLPQTSAASAVASAATAAPKENDPIDDDGDREPLVFSSLADLMEMAGTLPAQRQRPDRSKGDGDSGENVHKAGTIKPGSVVETHLSFQCMDPETYKEKQSIDQLELQMQAWGLSDGTGNDNGVDDDEEESSDGGGDRDGDDDSSRDSLFDLLHGAGDSDADESGDPAQDDDEDPGAKCHENGDADEYYPSDGEENEARPPKYSEQRLFLVLWKALSEWVTPEAVRHVRRINAGSGNSESLSPPSYDRSDIGASRCAGLMAQLHMHFEESFSQVREYRTDLPAGNNDNHQADTSQVRISVQRRLADLLRLWDYRRPNPPLDTKQMKALCCVLIDTVLPSAVVADQAAPAPSDENLHHNGIDDPDAGAAPRLGTNFGLPRYCEELTIEEYRYLTRSAISSFGTADDADDIS